MKDAPLDPPARLLVIDDQQANLKIVGGILGRLGFEAVLVGDAEAALAALTTQAVDLVLLDVLMPGCDGFETCARIRANAAWSDIPIIFLSAADDKGLIVRALEVGGVDYITKPFNAAELTSRVRTHLALKAARDELKQLARDKDELLGILAHDLKNHLGGMKMSVHLLRERAAKLSDPRLKQMAGNIDQGTEQMHAFVVEFLANSAVDHQLHLKCEPVWLHEIIAASILRYEDAARRKKIRLEQGGTASEPVSGDRKALERIFDNLISNAIKFSAAETTVRVHLGDDAVPGGGAICRVRDEGPGFTEEDKVLMFARYRRLSALPTSGEPSTGLGLSIVRKLTRDIGGDITCESRFGAGATFVLRFASFPSGLPASDRALS